MFVRASLRVERALVNMQSSEEKTPSSKRAAAAHILPHNQLHPMQKGYVPHDQQGCVQKGYMQKGYVPHDQQGYVQK
eukprot:scaffold18082_cov18-Tisochrysis_lutea.AAC.2